MMHPAAAGNFSTMGVNRKRLFRSFTGSKATRVQARSAPWGPPQTSLVSTACLYDFLVLGRLSKRPLLSLSRSLSGSPPRHPRSPQPPSNDCGSLQAPCSILLRIRPLLPLSCLGRPGTVPPDICAVRFCWCCHFTASPLCCATADYLFVSGLGGAVPLAVLTLD